MRRILSGILGVMLAACATVALAQSKPPLKLGGILDMSGLYADITGPGAEMAAKMAAEDFGGEVLGRKIEIIAADHLNKADLAANIARDMLDNQGVEMIYDVAASATALAAGDIAKARNKIVMFSGPGSIRLSNYAALLPYQRNDLSDSQELLCSALMTMTRQRPVQLLRPQRRQRLRPPLKHKLFTANPQTSYPPARQPNTNRIPRRKP